MKYTYLLINLIFLIPGLLWFMCVSPAERRRQLKAIAVLVVLTAIFDNLLIAMHLYAYDPKRTLGILIGRAPIEDFAYSAQAVFITTYLWSKLHASHATERDT